MVHWARTLSGFRFIYCEPKVEPGLTGSGPSPFQLYEFDLF